MVTRCHAGSERQGAMCPIRTVRQNRTPSARARFETDGTLIVVVSMTCGQSAGGSVAGIALASRRTSQFFRSETRRDHKPARPGRFSRISRFQRPARRRAPLSPAAEIRAGGPPGAPKVADADHGRTRRLHFGVFISATADVNLSRWNFSLSKKSSSRTMLTAASSSVPWN